MIWITELPIIPNVWKNQNSCNRSFAELCILWHNIPLHEYESKLQKVDNSLNLQKIIFLYNFVYLLQLYYKAGLHL